jgi:hypothetical protein
MQLVAIALSSIAIQLNWISDPGDTPQDSVAITESGPNGQTQSQAGLQWLGGTTFFGNLKANTTYHFQMIGSLQTDSGQTYLTLASTSATTLKAGSKPNQPSQQPPQQQGSGSEETPYSVVASVRAQAMPFGKIVVSWTKTGNWAAQLKIQRSQIPNGPILTVFTAQNYNSDADFLSDSFTDTGPFEFNTEYNYWIIATNGQRTADTPSPQPALYPKYFGLREYLPPGFDPTQGVKSLGSNNQPYVSVREIMSDS